MNNPRRKKQSERAPQKSRAPRSTKLNHRLKKKDVKFGVSFFTGPLRVKSTGQLLMCDICETQEGTWRHERKDGGSCLLCFGCGNH